MKLVKTNIDGFLKNTDTGMVINKNYSEYDLILQKREHEREIDRMKEQLESEMEKKIEQKLREILGDKISSS